MTSHTSSGSRPAVVTPPIPDEGSTVEVYTNDRDVPYIEMEVLGPHRPSAAG